MKPKMQLSIENITIIPFEEKYINQTYLNWMNDKQVVEYTGHRDKTYALEDLELFFKSIDWKHRYFFAILDNTTMKHIGNCTINSIDYDHLTFDKGVLIGDKSYWGGRTTEYVVAMLMHFCFHKLNMRRFFGGCISGHHKTIFILKKMGFPISYIKKEAFIHNGKILNHLVFTMDLQTWLNLEKKYPIKGFS